MERDFVLNVAGGGINHFNSHAHVERDIMDKETWLTADISTHTLTWSVTYDNTADFINQNISTHTLTWSVTYNIIFGKRSNGISTHTLTWSVTCDS